MTGGENAHADRGCLARAPRTRSADGAHGRGSLLRVMRRRYAASARWRARGRDLTARPSVSSRAWPRSPWLSLAGRAAVGGDGLLRQRPVEARDQIDRVLDADADADQAIDVQARDELG